MYKIGDFSNLAKVTVKTLRYYDSQGLLKPSNIDKFTGYRYYESNQLLELNKIISLRQLGMSIKDIKKVLKGENINQLLFERKAELEKQIYMCNDQLSRINYIIGGINMSYEAIVKELPSYVVYYKEGIIDSFPSIVPFILGSGEECRKLNPDIKCIEPDYCYVSYLDGEYKDKDIKVRYAQAVTEKGNENENIKFETLKPVNAVCVYHKGSYSSIGEAYGYAIKWIEENGYEIAEPIRERYIDGMWNKEDENDWLTEVQVPIRKK